jgi:SAM-dependent methyltransferase
MTERTTYDLLTEHLARPGFMKAVLSGPQPGSPWKKVTIRTVELQRGPALQIVRLDARQADTKTVDRGDPLVDETCRLMFRHLTIQMADAVVESRVTKKGALLVTTTPVASEALPVSTAHDRQKARLVAETAPFLDALGLASGGSLKPTGQRKYRQINEFIRAFMGATGVEEILRESPIRVVDFGCGNAYLTFAVYHHLHVTLGLPCEVVGIDRNGPLMERANERAAKLGWAGLTFREGDIGDAPLAVSPHVVIALHACDTATDDVLSRTVGWGSSLVLVSPCCHHDVQRQLKASAAPADYSSMLRKGLLKERLGDVLTDSLRCDLLGLVGYQSEVIEFISLEHTAKNLMIRAHRTDREPSADQVDQYVSLRDQWHIEPYLEAKLSDRLPPLLTGRGG